MKKTKFELMGEFQDWNSLLKKSEEFNSFLDSALTNLQVTICKNIQPPMNIGYRLNFTKACVKEQDLRKMYVSGGEFTDYKSSEVSIDFGSAEIYYCFNSNSKIKCLYETSRDKKFLDQLVQNTEEEIKEIFEMLDTLWYSLNNKRLVFLKKQIDNEEPITKKGTDILDYMN